MAATVLWMPPAEEVARAEAWLYEGRSEAGVDPKELLKGFVDRVFLPGFAFKYRPGKAFPAQLLKGRTAQLLVTMDTPPW